MRCAEWWEEYALDYCYVQNTYFLPFTSGGPVRNYWELGVNTDITIVDIPNNTLHREEKMIGRRRGLTSRRCIITSVPV